MNFLLVDDDADDILLFDEIISEVAPTFHFSSANDGQEALDNLRNGKPLPDLIFLDLNMPRMGGKECLLQLKSDEQLQHIPVIMFTTSSQSKDIEETMMNGAICFITKPTNFNELKYIISSIAESMPHQLLPTLRRLSESTTTFIVC